MRLKRGSHPLRHLLGCGRAPAALRTKPQRGANRTLCAVYINAAARDTASRLLPNLPVEEPARLCGDVQGATSALHLALALLARPAGPVLVLTVEPGACVALVASLAVDADLKHAG